MGDQTAFSELERAELAARERRLVAETEASRIIDAARAQVREIEAAVAADIARGLARAARRSRARTRREVGAIEDRLRDLVASISAQATDPSSGRAAADDHRDRFEAAVELVVAAVLGEAEA